MEKSEVKAIKVLASLSGITSLHFKFCKEIVIRETKFSLQNKFDYNSKPKSEQKRIDKFIEKEVIRLNQYFAIIHIHCKEIAPCQLSPSETCPRPLTAP
jgi:hypothetical protein